MGGGEGIAKRIGRTNKRRRSAAKESLQLINYSSLFVFCFSFFSIFPFGPTFFHLLFISKLEPPKDERNSPPDFSAADGVEQPKNESVDGFRLSPPPTTATATMPTLVTPADGGQIKKQKPKSLSPPAIALFGAVALILAFGILGVSIATLIRTFQNGQNNEMPGTTTASPPTVTPTPSASTKPTTTSAAPTTLSPLEELHIPEPAKMQKDENSEEYQAYSNFTERLTKSLNLSQSPCDNFYEYACGNFKGPISFDQLTVQNVKTFVGLVEDERYSKNPKLPLPVKQSIQFYQKCVGAMSDWSAEVGDGSRLRKKMIMLENLLDGVPFPAVSAKTQLNMMERPSVDTLSIALGYLSNDEGVNTFVSVGVSTNWLEPHGEHPYTLHFDQARLLLPTNYYLKAWENVRAMLHANLVSSLKAYTKFAGANVTNEQIDADAREVMDMELTIATNLLKAPDERRKFAPQSNTYTFEKADKEMGEYLDFGLFAFWALKVPEGVDPAHIEPFYIHEPKVIKSTMQFLDTISPRTLYNYLYIRLLSANLNYLPVSHRLGKIPGLLSARGIGIPTLDDGGIIENPWPYDQDGINFGGPEGRNRAMCASINAQYFTYANARIFLDAQLPEKEQRTKLRENLRTMVAGVVDSFRGMVAQLDWMSSEAKRASFLKMDNLVTNLAWPDFVEDDAALSEFYSLLAFREEDTFTQMKDKLRDFWTNSQAERLFFANDTDRLDFGIPSIVNAWYSSSRNSITFPLGILSKPFYDPNFPASVNYGALGVIAGHELSHGFDDEGIQWDGTGTLRGWMDAASEANFEQMAQCVVDEYAQFEPLSGMHIDGTMTQGENIADNGGIRAAFRAFQTHVGLFGPDPRLPHELFGQFSHQQLFFLSFAQIWCQSPPDPQEQFFNLLVNPHSPAKYRILGSLQNFPAFRQAFHCAADTNYSPKTHCNVWESESAPAAMGVVPPTPNTPKPLNIPTQPIESNDKFKRAAELFEHSVDTRHDPCESFYEYSCGRFSNNEQTNLEAAQGKAFDALLDGLSEPIDTAVDIRPVVLVKQLFQQCKNTIPKWRIWTHGAVRARHALEKFRMATELDFPLFQRKSAMPTWPNAAKLGNALGYLSGVEGVDTLLTTFVDVDWMEPQNADGQTFRLHFDQASLALPRPYYVGKAWELVKEAYRTEIGELFTDYAKATGLKMKQNLWTVGKEIMELEWTIANKLMKAENERRDYKAMSHGAMLSLSNVTFVELGPFVRALTKRANRYNSARILHILTSKPVILAEPKLFEQYNSAFSERNRFGFNASQLLNYLYYRLLLEYRNFIPGQNGGDGMKNDGQQQNQMHEHSDELKGFKATEMIRPIEGEEKRGTGRTDGEEGEGRGWIRRKMLHRYERKKPSVGKPTFRKTNRLPKLKNYGLLEEYCAVQTMEYLPNANGRVLVDRMIPGAKERTVFRNKFGKVVSAVVDGFKSMLEQLEWIQTADKRRAIQKADNIVRNIGYSELITDDLKLSFQLERLNWRNGPDTPFFEMLEDIEQFRSANKWDALLKIGPADRQQFDASPAIANAWYMPQLNSITFPLAILQPPFFDSEWPDSVNYGAIGVIIGHELSHAFDDEGIQWGDVGGLSDWMGNASMGAFRKMAECVVDEYGAFCPLNGTGMSPSCIDGSATQGENIADNGGIEAAFRAFRNSLSFYGPNPRLPGSLAAQFSDDQLFFLSFARIWCQRPMDDDENEMLATLLLDPHAPPKFRVFGTLRNFPAFRTAFNCPIGKKYAPSETEHCNVWVDEIKAVSVPLRTLHRTRLNKRGFWEGIEQINGIPINEEELPPINVPKLGQSDNELFARTAKLFSKSMDSKKDPCNDFYGYACANFEGPIHFERIQQQSVFYSLIALVDNFMDIPKTLPMRQSKEFFGKCLNDMANWRQLTKGSRVVIEHMAKFQRRKRMPFPLVDEAKGKETDYKWPTPDMLGSALGQLSTIYGIDTLLGSFVDTNWGDPHGVQPYFLFIDQGSLALPQKYYSDPIWARINKTYVDEVTHLLGRYINALGVELNETEVRTVAEQIGQFEHTLANQLMAEGEKRNNFSRMYNPVTFMKMDDESLAWVDLQSYILEMLFTSASWEVFDRMLQQRNTIVVMEPEIMEKRSNAFRPGNPFGFVPAHLFNYLNFRLLLTLSPFFESDSPLGSQLFRSVSSERFIRPPIGRPRWDEPIFDLDEFFTAEEAAQSSEMNPFLALFGCVLSSLDLLPHHSSRLYLDLVLPKERARQNLRKSVNEMVENVVVGFDSMLDQLEWMNEKSKKNAAEKVDNLVRNIAFPDWLVDDHKLAAYCERFPLNSEDNLIETQFRVSNFLLRESLELLTLKGPTNRTNFNGLPMMVNAWYQPELNSITLPLAILSPPFFHQNNPTALNYGILGAIVGHELTHAFDSVGTQFDAFGKLRQWMEPSSKAAFDAMVQCVIRQYGRFCPLPAQDGTANCVDGILSQRENVADNGGIRAAYRAYQNAMELRGAELTLPGPLLSQYDHDQLFFLAFAQIWCQSAEDPAKTSRRLLLDPHPPPKFRVLGSLQNFPAFQNAFNCPKDSLYAPKEHCDVWISEVKQVNGDNFLPPPPSLNIPQKESELTPKFREASEYFEKSVDIAQDPCNNFYEYACNAFDEITHFDRISIQNLITLATELRANNVHQQIEPIQKAKLAFEKCTFLMHHQNQVIVQADLPREKFFLFQKKSRLDFPVFAGQTMDWPSREELSKALGALSGSVMVDTLISFFVDTNWADPNSEEMPYALFVDQPTLAFDPYYYSPEVFPIVSHQMERIVDEVLTEMANYLGVEYARKDLNAAVQEVIAFERLLANNFLVSDAIRENDLGSRFNLFTVSDAQLRFPFLNWSLFLRELAQNAPQIVQEKLRQPNFRFAIAEPTLLAKLGDDLGPGNKHNLTANQLLNYLYFRMILFYSPYIPQAFTGKNATLNVPITQNWPKRAAKSGHIIKPISNRDYFFYRPSIGKPRRMEIFEEKKLQKINAQIDYSEFLCASYSLAMMDLVGGRLWLDQTMPNEESRHNLRKGAQRLMDSILLSFRSMVQQISWMSPRAKASAHAKLDKITANIGWPQTMVNNSKLEQYYEQLRFTDKDNFLIIWDKTMKFSYAQQWAHLLKRKGTDRTEFNGQIILTNAWYQPELNSITVPASILAQPFFDTEWPEAVIFGAIGVVLGHELSHGFDNHGVQWDAEGAANKWMDAHSQRAFDRMAKCVVDEYSQLCPFPPDGIVQPACIDGDKTQAENIADNGGLHAAFRAYRSALEVDGPSKALPGKLVGRFNHDQLFFLSFAQPWCDQPDDFETYLQLIGDSHSPAKFRVFGSLRNFPAFRNAFNCPLNSKYAPEKHCNVWVSPVT